MELSDKILFGILGFKPFELKKESLEIKYMIDCDKLSFARWYLFMHKQTDDFDKWSDDEIILMYKKDRDEISIRRFK